MFLREMLKVSSKSLKLQILINGEWQDFPEQTQKVNTCSICKQFVSTYKSTRIRGIDKVSKEEVVVLERIPICYPCYKEIKNATQQT